MNVQVEIVESLFSWWLSFDFGCEFVHPGRVELGGGQGREGQEDSEEFHVDLDLLISAVRLVVVVAAVVLKEGRAIPSALYGLVPSSTARAVLVR